MELTIMLWYENSESVFVPWGGESLPTMIDTPTGPEINEVQHPRSIEQLWSDEELAAIGLYRPVHDSIPAGKEIVSSTVARVNGVVKFIDVYRYIPGPVYYVRIFGIVCVDLC
jgi:hypothetical protein